MNKAISDTYNMTDRKLDGISNGLCSLGYQELQNINGVNTNIANSTAAVQNTLTQGFAGINTGMVQQGYENRIAVNGVGTQLASCLTKFFKAIKNLCTNEYAVGSIA